MIILTDQIHRTKTFNNGKTQMPYYGIATTQSWDLDGTAISQVVQTTEIDDYGNPVYSHREITDITGIYTKTINSVYDNSVSSWILGKLTQSTTTLTAPGASDIIRTVNLSTSTTGILEKKVIDPGDVNQLTYEYQYDGFGNRRFTTLSAAGEPLRTSEVGYTPDGRFPSYTKNALGQQLTTQTDGRFGHPTIKTSPNGQQKEILYDIFGQEINEISYTPDEDENAQEVIEKLWCEGNSSCPDNAVFLVRAADNQGESPGSIYLDMLGRRVRQQSFGVAPSVDGQESNPPVVFTDIEYNEFGKQSKVSKPYFEGDTPRWTESRYDALGRVIQTIASNGATTTKTYAGLTTRILNAKNQLSTTESNS